MKKEIKIIAGIIFFILAFKFASDFDMQIKELESIEVNAYGE
jgi:hypothetical protein